MITKYDVGDSALRKVNLKFYPVRKGVLRADEQGWNLAGYDVDVQGQRKQLERMRGGCYRAIDMLSLTHRTCPFGVDFGVKRVDEAHLPLSNVLY